MSKDFDVNKIRQDFPILDRTINGNKLAYLDNASSSQSSSDNDFSTDEFDDDIPF